MKKKKYHLSNGNGRPECNTPGDTGVVCSRLTFESLKKKYRCRKCSKMLKAYEAKEKQLRVKLL